MGSKGLTSEKKVGQEQSYDRTKKHSVCVHVTLCSVATQESEHWASMKNIHRWHVAQFIYIKR